MENTAGNERSGTHLRARRTSEPLRRRVSGNLRETAIWLETLIARKIDAAMPSQSFIAINLSLR